MSLSMILAHFLLQTLAQYLNRMRMSPLVRACMLEKDNRVWWIITYSFGKT